MSSFVISEHYALCTEKVNIVDFFSVRVKTSLAICTFLVHAASVLCSNAQANEFSKIKFLSTFNNDVMISPKDEKTREMIAIFGLSRP